MFNINIFSQLSVPELGKQTLLSSQVLMPDSHACPHGPENQTWRKPDMEKPVVSEPEMGETIPVFVQGWAGCHCGVVADQCAFITKEEVVSWFLATEPSTRMALKDCCRRLQERLLLASLSLKGRNLQEGKKSERMLRIWSYLATFPSIPWVLGQPHLKGRDINLSFWRESESLALFVIPCFHVRL